MLSNDELVQHLYGDLLITAITVNTVNNLRTLFESKLGLVNKNYLKYEGNDKKILYIEQYLPFESMNLSGSFDPIIYYFWFLVLCNLSYAI